MEKTSPASMRAAHLIERLGRLLRAQDHAGGLNPAQWEALRYLARANRFSRSPAALAAYLGATRGTVSQTLISLEGKGLARREAHPKDGRAVRLELTEAGRAKLAGDALQAIAAAVEAGGRAETLAEGLEGALRAALARRGGRAFGACQTCAHFRRDVRAGEAPHHCGLLDEPLTPADSLAICQEHAAR